MGVPGSGPACSHLQRHSHCTPGCREIDEKLQMTGRLICGKPAPPFLNVWRKDHLMMGTRTHTRRPTFSQSKSWTVVYERNLTFVPQNDKRKKKKQIRRKMNSRLLHGDPGRLRLWNMPPPPPKKILIAHFSSFSGLFSPDIMEL